MLGNDKLNDVRPVGAEAEHSGPKDGWHEEALGRNAILGGFQGQRQWTDFMPNGDFTELCSTPPSTGTARKSRSLSLPRTTVSTVCRCSWASSSPAERACSPMFVHTGAPTLLKESAACAPRRCQGRLHPPHQLRRRRARRHWRLQGQGRQRSHEGVVERHRRGYRRYAQGYRLVPRRPRIFQRRRIFLALQDSGCHAHDNDKSQHHQGSWPGASDSRGLHRHPAR